jgi:hypothetical protein
MSSGRLNRFVTASRLRAGESRSDRPQPKEVRRVKTRSVNVRTWTVAALASGIAVLFLLAIAPGVGAAAVSTSSCHKAGATGLTAKIVAAPHQFITGTVNAAGCDLGIYIGSGAVGVRISHATVMGANDEGILAQDTSDLVVAHSAITGNGLHPHICSHTTSPPGCIAEDKELELVGTSHSVVTGNSVTNAVTDGGIAVLDDGPFNPGALGAGTLRAASSDSVLGNTIQRTQGGCGILIAAFFHGAGVRGVLVQGNTVVGSKPGTGPYVGQIIVATDGPNATVWGVKLLYNHLYKSLLPGIALHANAPGDLIANTLVKGNFETYNAGYPPSFATPNTPSKFTAISVVAEAYKGMPSPPQITGTTIVDNTSWHDFYGVFTCKATDTVISGVMGNPVQPVGHC